jgi:transposase InsO family protein
VFLKAHWEEIAATDFFTTEVWTPTGLRTYYVLFFIEFKTRRVHLAGLTANPTDLFMGHTAERALGFLRETRFLICDRDSKFSLRFRIVLEAAGIHIIQTPFQAPNANAYAERFVRSIKEECLNRMILFGEAHLCHALEQFIEHYHLERNHQGLGNELIEGGALRSSGEVVVRERLGGLLKYYRQAA